MSLKFYFGPSGVGKSRQLYSEIIERSKRNQKKNFLIIVPDQFTMQTQKEFVELTDGNGIMNIDVLSFGRLTHRILEEVGTADVPVLDDTGKSLVLQKVASGMKDSLPCLGGFLHKQGYIHEIKSAISEFMQYGISVDGVGELIRFAEGRGALVHKLKDLQCLYKGFLEYINGHYITTEEKLDVLRRSLESSRLIKDSVVVFDGFTGFTPIQTRLMQEIMVQSGQTIVVMTLGAGENPYERSSEQGLFYLTEKTVADLSRLAAEANVAREKDVLLLPAGIEDAYLQEFEDRCSICFSGVHRFVNAPALAALERNLLRYKTEEYEGETEQVQIFEASTPREEIRQCGLYIHRLLREGYEYRDIAVVSGDLQGYAPYVESEFAKLEIPVYLDRTRPVTLNPLVEMIKSALDIYLKNFSYDAVFHYLRCGMAGFAAGDVDMLENYVLQLGLKGRKRWENLFTRKTGDMTYDIAYGHEDEETEGREAPDRGEQMLARLNDIRAAFMVQIEALNKGGKAAAAEYTECLYDFLVQTKAAEKLEEYALFFESSGEAVRAGEYRQIYRLVMQLLEQIHTLLGEEQITLQEFRDILEAGFAEIEVGTIPQNVDRVLVGDMERTRIKQVKVLFFLGVNDGNIPKSTAKGGIISDMDREFLRESSLELAPSPRQQMFIQRLYLYLNMTKPSRRLYLSYSKIDKGGKSMRPAYLIDVVRKLFPGVPVQKPEEREITEQIATKQEGLDYLAELLRGYAEGTLTEDQLPEFYTVYHAYGEERLAEKREMLARAAFKRYKDSGLSVAVARALYGQYLENSVSRLETFAACAYHHFLQYGLGLKERELFGLEPVDMGNIYHSVLEQFAKGLKDSDFTWFDFPEEYAQSRIEEILEGLAVEYGNSILYSNERNRYAITRMKRILERTVMTLQNQLKQGSFKPEHFEYSFHFADNLDSVNINLSTGEKMRLKGRIDRIDTWEDDERVYVKVIDYKSGNKKFDLVALYYGLSLQLVVYMNAAMELERQAHPGKEVVPGALLYYHVDDPMVEAKEELSPEEINDRILTQLRMNGVVNGEPDIIEKIDAYMGSKSRVVPVEKKKDGTFSSRSDIMSTGELQIVSDYVGKKVADLGRGILSGRITMDPYERKGQDACTYCAYKKVCGFDTAVPGYEKRSLAEMEDGDILKGMKTYGD